MTAERILPIVRRIARWSDWVMWTLLGLLLAVSAAAWIADQARDQALEDLRAQVEQLVSQQVGPQGPAGARGPQGQEGPAGRPGPQGEAGESGPVGPRGAQGAAGVDGRNGRNGTDGRNGVTACNPYLIEKGPLAGLKVCVP